MQGFIPSGEFVSSFRNKYLNECKKVKSKLYMNSNKAVKLLFIAIPPMKLCLP